MTRRTAFIAAAVAAGAIGLGATAAGAAAVGGDDSPITGSDLERATEAALAHTGEGRVSDTEVDGDAEADDKGSYEVEVVLDDGSQVEVELDASFDVVSAEVDHEDAADDED